MEGKVKVEIKKVALTLKALRSSLDKSNVRLVKKYIVQLKDNNESLLQAFVTAEINNIDAKTDFMIEASQALDTSNDQLLVAEEFLMEIEVNDEDAALNKVSKAKFDDLISLLSSFKESIINPARKLFEEGKDVTDSFNSIIESKRKQLTELNSQRIELISQLSIEDDTSLKDLYLSTSKELEDWVIMGFRDLNINPTPTAVESQQHDQTLPSKNKGPSLKLDRLALPIFRGNMRHFARFIMDFEATVGLEFSDPRIKLMYLVNQCLEGAPKDLVRNVVSYEDAIDRLQQRTLFNVIKIWSS